MAGRLLLVAAVAMITLGCAPNVRPESYSIGSVGQVNRSVAAVVVSARLISIDGTTGSGAAVGGLAGAVGGSSVGGSGRANAIGAVGGAIVGSIIGAAVERSESYVDGLEYVVESSNGSLMTIVQGAEPVLPVGSHVLVLYGSPARIIKDPRY